MTQQDSITATQCIADKRVPISKDASTAAGIAIWYDWHGVVANTIFT